MYRQTHIHKLETNKVLSFFSTDGSSLTRMDARPLWNLVRGSSRWVEP